MTTLRVEDAGVPHYRRVTLECECWPIDSLAEYNPRILQLAKDNLE
jgi:hypothetical protein